MFFSLLVDQCVNLYFRASNTSCVRRLFKITHLLSNLPVLIYILLLSALIKCPIRVSIFLFSLVLLLASFELNQVGFFTSYSDWVSILANITLSLQLRIIHRIHILLPFFNLVFLISSPTATSHV